jgi:hypothetical protein
MLLLFPFLSERFDICTGFSYGEMCRVLRQIPIFTPMNMPRHTRSIICAHKKAATLPDAPTRPRPKTKVSDDALLSLILFTFMQAGRKVERLLNQTSLFLKA